MNDEGLNGSWSLKDLRPEFYARFDIDSEIIEAIQGVSESITDATVKPETRLEAYRTLDKLLQGNNAVYRTPIIMSLAGSNEVQAAVANGCGPAGLGIFPGGWWEECCNEHDECYARGGSVADKLLCDAAFWKCLWSHGAPIIAEVYELAVLLFGWFAFDWGDNGATKPPPCSGTCRGTEYRISGLRNFRTVGSSVAQIVANFVSPIGRARLEAKAEEQSRIEFTKPCQSGCRANITTTGQWQRHNVTVLFARELDPRSDVRSVCDATVWKRDVSGICQ